MSTTLKNFAVFLCWLLVLGPLSGQNLTAPLLSGSWQSTYHNPAMLHFLPGAVTVGLPGISNDFRLENLNYRDLYVSSGGQRILDLNALAALTGDRNSVQEFFSIETLGLAVRTDRMAFSAYHRLRLNGNAEYSGDLVDVIALGNAPFIGATVDLAPRATVLTFQEVGFGLSYAVSDAVAVAGRIKYLAGSSAVQTSEGGSLRLTTGTENYALTLDQDITLRTVNAIEYNESLSDIRFEYFPERLTPGDLFGSNTGMAIDVGVAVDLDRLRLNASATDLSASIEWDDDVTNLEFSGSNTFSGLDILADLLRDSVSLNTALDSLVGTFDPQASTGNFTTKLAPTYYLGGEYDISDRVTTGALLVLEDRLGEAAVAAAITANYAVTDWLRLGLNANMRSGLGTHLGANLFISAGSFQFFASSDKLFSLLGTGRPEVAGVRIGAALSLAARDRSFASFHRESR